MEPRSNISPDFYTGDPHPAQRRQQLWPRCNKGACARPKRLPRLLKIRHLGAKVVLLQERGHAVKVVTGNKGAFGDRLLLD